MLPSTHIGEIVKKRFQLIRTAPIFPEIPFLLSPLFLAGYLVRRRSASASARSGVLQKKERKVQPAPSWHCPPSGVAMPYTAMLEEGVKNAKIMQFIALFSSFPFRAQVPTRLPEGAKATCKRKRCPSVCLSVCDRKRARWPPHFMAAIDRPIEPNNLDRGGMLKICLLKFFIFLGRQIFRFSVFSLGVHVVKSGGPKGKVEKCTNYSTGKSGKMYKKIIFPKLFQNVPKWSAFLDVNPKTMFFWP